MAYGELKVDSITFTDGGSDATVSVSGLVKNPTFSGDIVVSGNISGVTITGDSAGFGSVTGVTVTGTTANFVTVSGTTVTGDTGNFTSLSAITAIITSGIFASGTAADPSVLVGSSGIGLYSPGANQVALVASGTEKISIDDGGRIILETNAYFGTDNYLYFNGTTSLGAEDAIGKSLSDSALIIKSSNNIFVDIDSRGLGGTPEFKITKSGATTDLLVVQANGVVSGDTAKFTTVSGTAITGDTAGFTTVTGTTVTGTTANFNTVSGTTVTGGTGNFTSISATTTTITSGVFASGTAAAPSVSVGTTDNGLYSPDTNQVAISTNGAQALYINSDGDILVADGNRMEIDEIRARDGAGLKLFDDAGAGIFIQDGGNVGLGTSSPDEALDVVGRVQIKSTAQPKLILKETTVSKEYSARIGGTGQFFLRDESAAVDRIAVLTGGNVGIGTTSPSETLEVAGNVILDTSSATLRIKQGVTGTTGAIDFTLNSDSTSYGSLNLDYDQRTTQGLRLNTAYPLTLECGAAEEVIFKRSTTETARIDSSGRLLVGTSNTLTGTSGYNDGTLQVSNSTSGQGGAAGLVAFAWDTGTGQNDAPIVQLNKSASATRGTHAIVGDGNTLGSIIFSGSDGTNFEEAARIETEVDGTPGTDDMPGRLVFSTNGGAPDTSPTERMRITSTGYLKASYDGSYYQIANPYHEFIADGSNGLAFHIENQSATTPYGARILFSGAAPNDATRYFLLCQDSTATRAAIRSNGGLANYQSNNVDLSDERTKRDISAVSSTWDCVQSWDVVNYNYLDDTQDETARIGVIAQQVQQHCPEVVIPYQESQDAVVDDEGNIVTPATEERLGVREQQMMWMAIKALQEAQLRIETLEAKVNALEGN